MRRSLLKWDPSIPNLIPKVWGNVDGWPMHEVDFEDKRTSNSFTPAYVDAVCLREKQDVRLWR